MNFADAAQGLVGFARDNPDWIVLIVFMLAFLEFLPFVWVLLFGMAALVGPSDPGRLWLVIAAAAFGGAAGDGLLYAIGHANHERANNVWPLKNHPALIEKTRSFFQRWGVWAIVFGRFAGPVRFSVPIVAGALHMQYALFQIGTFASALVWAIVFFWPTAWGADWVFGFLR